jgi:YegS/Rv2252/BmrU family lipid kinase
VSISSGEAPAAFLFIAFSIIRVLTYRKAFIIYNPYAGRIRGRADSYIGRALEILAAQGHRAEAVATTGPRTAAGIARTCLEQGADLILVAGGDGTLNEAINGMVHSHVPVGLLPAGTANVLGVELGISTRIEIAAKLISDCSAERIAVGRLRCAGEEPRHFALMAGAGLDAHIVYHVSAGLKSALGKVAYWIAGFQHGMRVLPQFTVEAGGKEYRASFALASRVRNYGGDLWIAPNVTLLDHDFEVVLFGGANPLRYVKYLAAVLVKRAVGRKGVTVFRAESLRLSCPEDRRIYVQVDGEYAGRLPAEIEIVPDALTMLIPTVFSARARERDTWTTLPTR